MEVTKQAEETKKTVETKNKERRRHARVELTGPIKYRPFRNESIFKDNYSVGRINNISLGGLKFALGKHNPTESKLDMEIELSDVLSFYAVGKVVGGEDRAVDGIIHQFDRICFLEMDKEVQDLLMRLVFEYMRRSGSKAK
jgi:c-di-GMP-binding flagellar brake protein YcgR